MIARDAGAQDAVASAARSAGLDASMRESELEEMTRSETLEIGVRVIVDRRQACVSGSIATPDTLREMSERAIAMAREAPEDPFCGLASPEKIGAASTDLELFDPLEAQPDALHQGRRV